MQRQAGILVPLFSLRTARDTGAGTLSDLVPFARWAASAGFRTVQILPMNEVCPGLTSPYSAASAFAIDPVYLSLERLAEDLRSLLDETDRELCERLRDDRLVRWDEVRGLKRRAARRAFAVFRERGDADAINRFAAERSWVREHALFMALHGRHQASWLDWPTPLRDRDPHALEAARRELADDVAFETWLQWHLDEEWRAMRAALRETGVALMGDLPFVVAHDSSDVWSRREAFRLDASLGVPPTTPEEAPQDWGLPVYDWDSLRGDDFRYIRERAARQAELYDAYRVDHVIGLFRSFWKRGDETGFSPPDEPSQRAQGEAMLAILGAHADVVAEDLGLVPPFIRHALTALAIPGYRVLRWEKDDGVYRDPATWPTMSVATTGTHDTDAAATWFEGLDATERAALARVPGLEVVATRTRYDLEVKDAILRVLYRAPSDLVFLPLQDALGRAGQINVPGTVSPDNWSWRMETTIEALASDEGQRAYLERLARESGRL